MMKELELKFPDGQVVKAAPGTTPAHLLLNGRIEAPADVLAAQLDGHVSMMRKADTLIGIRQPI
jgi:hypothetical protein